MAYCSICNENDVTDPCESLAEAREGGCINPTKAKRGISLELAKKIEEEQKEIHSKSSGPGSWT